MSRSPLVNKARARLAEQRQKDMERWQTGSNSFRRTMIRWMLRIVAITLILVLALYRIGGGRFF
ncbi:MAG TPA: hypothetical protein VKZ79_05045 [Alphaproteobacteria bacterium]|nr:hypothetical protein [Alphaproteobacteria bacterium]